MSEISFLIDQSTKKRYARIDLGKVATYTDEQLEELLDVLVAEARKDDKKISIAQLEKKLKKAGKL